MRVPALTLSGGETLIQSMAIIAYLDEVYPDPPLLPVDALDTQGCIALLRAAGGGHRAVVDLLLARGADPKIAARSGATFPCLGSKWSAMQSSTCTGPARRRQRLGVCRR